MCVLIKSSVVRPQVSISAYVRREGKRMKTSGAQGSVWNFPVSLTSRDNGTIEFVRFTSVRCDVRELGLIL